MKKSFYSRRGNLKSIIFLFGFLLIITGIIYTQSLVSQLKQKASQDLQFKIKIFEQFINDPSNDLDFSFLLNEVIDKADYPLIYTDSNHRPQNCRNISPELDTMPLTELSKSDSLKLWHVFEQIRLENNPIPIQAQGVILGYYYYGYSSVIYKLNNLPYIAVFAGVLFILLGYLGFSHIRKSEQRFVWVGMAKETAHQLGTPLSALSGWVELLTMHPEKLDMALNEIRHDIERLNKVTNRFSKIGSIPALQKEKLNNIISMVVAYFHRRLPNMQKRISLHQNIKEDLYVELNADLFEWVLENIIKNAIDAIGDKNGKIVISAGYTNDHKNIYIDVTDSGKGISTKEKTLIFRPGFSSKKRGWGLGLSLSKRIIEEYHDGKLFLKESKPGRMSTFRILLKA